MKKNPLLLAFLILGMFTINAQEWLTDLNTAQKNAKKLGRNIVLVFQGSDWCAPCMKLEKEIWSSEEFISYSKDHFVLLKADFPKKRKNLLAPSLQEKNNQLAEKYNSEGYFPLVVVLDSEGKVLGLTGYQKVAPSEFITILNSFK